MSQINFFMDEQDEAAFLAMLRERGDTALHVGRFFTKPAPTFAQRLPRFGSHSECQLTNSIITPEPRCHACGLGEHRGKFLFDLYKDLHIEFSRSYVDQGTLVSGRLYTKIGWVDPAEHNRLGQAWYQSLSRWIKGGYLKVRGAWWVGPSAEKWSRQGGQLAFGGPDALTESLRSAV